MKSLCVRMRKSTSAVVHAPASAVVGMMNSSGVSVVMAGIRYSSFTLSRPEDESIGTIITTLPILRLICGVCDLVLGYAIEM